MLQTYTIISKDMPKELKVVLILSVDYLFVGLLLMNHNLPIEAVEHTILFIKPEANKFLFWRPLYYKWRYIISSTSICSVQGHGNTHNLRILLNIESVVS